MWINPSNYNELRQELLKLPTGTHVKIPRFVEKDLKSDLQKTILGKLKGAIEQYRDTYESESVHIRVYKEYLEAHLDKKNPVYKPLEHLVEDASESFFISVALSSFTIIALLLWLKDRVS